MDGGRIDRDSDIGDDSPMSHIDEHSDREDDIRDCDSSDEGVNVNPHNTMTSGMEFGRSPDHHSDLNQSSHFGQNHPLGVLGNLTALNMNVQNLSNLSNLQHGDVLEKLKMQVRDMKVGLMDQDFPLHSTFGGTMQTNNSYTNSHSHQAQNLSQTNNTNGSSYPFTLPNPPISKDGNPGSNSSTSSETSNSSQQNNGWSFEEQFKQVRQLYEINDDPKRKEFLDDLFLFMQKRGTPINRLPIMAKSVLDLYELYNLVIARGGLVDVINKKLWQEIIKGLHLPSSITSAAFTLRTQYMKYLYPYECEKKNLSSPSELQAAIDGNRREGRRSSYGQFDSPSVQRSPVPQGMQQMSPLSLVTHVNQQQHHRLLGAPNVGQIPNLLPAEFEQRMLDYIKLFQPKEPKRAQSPEQITPRDALNALEMSRVALWNMYNNNTSPPNSLNTSPPELQRLFNREALNLSDSPPHHMSIKRERDHQVDYADRDRDYALPPPKRGHTIHNESLSPQKLNISHEEDENRPDTPVNIRENGLNHHEDDEEDHHRNNRLADTIKSQKQNGGNVNNNNNTNDFNATNSVGITGMQFKLISRGDAAKGDQQLVVSMEFNGVQYEGVLFANPSSSSSASSASSIGSVVSPTKNPATNSIEDRTSSSQHVPTRPLVS